MTEGTSSNECSVCLEEFTKEGDRCPKLLPCGHTLCVSCLGAVSQLISLKGLEIQCPECRVYHVLPPTGPKGFPTNSYILHILDLEKKITEKENENRQTVMCEDHQKPCVMFCLRRECWKTLCLKCPTQEHQESFRKYSGVSGTRGNETGSS